MEGTEKNLTLLCGGRTEQRSEKRNLDYSPTMKHSLLESADYVQLAAMQEQGGDSCVQPSQQSLDIQCAIAEDVAPQSRYSTLQRYVGGADARRDLSHFFHFGEQAASAVNVCSRRTDSHKPNIMTSFVGQKVRS